MTGNNCLPKEALKSIRWRASKKSFVREKAGHFRHEDTCTLFKDPPSLELWEIYLVLHMQCSCWHFVVAPQGQDAQCTVGSWESCSSKWHRVDGDIPHTWISVSVFKGDGGSEAAPPRPKRQGSSYLWVFQNYNFFVGEGKGLKHLGNCKSW